MRGLIRLFLMMLLPLGCGPLCAQKGARPERPRLVVLVSVDQLGSWVMEAAAPWFGAGGFRRIHDQGTTMTRCAFGHAVTFTGPGHATLGSGALPGMHGIVGNLWLDAAKGTSVYCVADPEVKAAVGVGGNAAISPRNLLAPTLGDTMKAHLGAKVRVVSLSWKDRSAVLMGGQGADVAVWFDKKTGLLTTSTWYGESAPKWVLEFNSQRPADAYFGKTWKRSGPPEAYAGLTDDRPFERPVVKGMRTLPRVLNGGRKKPSPHFYRQLYLSPYGNDLLLEATAAALSGMKLGQGPMPDMLCVSFSSNDAVGHAFGPISHEVRDITLRTDQQIARLLTMLDKQVGEGRYTVILSADHGVAPAPEALALLRIPSKKGFIGRKATQAAERALRAAFGNPPDGFKAWTLNTVESNLYFARGAMKKAGIDVVKAQDIASRAVLSVPGIAAAIGMERALRGQIPPHQIHLAMARTAHPLRSGDVLMALAPYWIGSPTVVASHGAPYAYDRAVPLMLMGRGIKKNYRSPTSVTPGAGVVLLAQLLGIPKPAMAFDALPVDVLNQ